jgi:hypothetical protein
MGLAEMKVFNEFYKDSTMETLGQRVEDLTTASGGAITIAPEGFTGDFLERTMWAALDDAVGVDRYENWEDIDATPLSQIAENTVKVAGRIGPKSYEQSQLSWLQKPTSEAIEMVSANLADRLLAFMLNNSIAAAVGAFQQGSGSSFVAPGQLTQGVLNQGHALFGDRSNRLVCDVIDSTTYHNIIGHNLANAENLFEHGSVTVVPILGKRVVVTDAPALRTGGATPQAYALSLVVGGMNITGTEDLQFAAVDATGSRILTKIQYDFSFGLNLLGYSFNRNMKSPTTTQIGSGANWTREFGNVKNTAGVVVRAAA